MYFLFTYILQNKIEYTYLNITVITSFVEKYTRWKESAKQKHKNKQSPLTVHSGLLNQNKEITSLFYQHRSALVNTKQQHDSRAFEIFLTFFYSYTRQTDN